jgi:hypothetical protein
MDNVPPGEVVPITGVEVVSEHRLRLTFRDGLVGDIDFGSHQWNGVFQPLRDPQRFARVAIEGPTIVWPEDGLDMAPETLYAQASEHPVHNLGSRAVA